MIKITLRKRGKFERRVNKRGVMAINYSVKIWMFQLNFPMKIFQFFKFGFGSNRDQLTTERFYWVHAVQNFLGLMTNFIGFRPFFALLLKYEIF